MKNAIYINQLTPPLIIQSADLKDFLFEIHLTIEDIDSSQIPAFDMVCQDLGGKAVIIELPVGVHTQQPMFTICQPSKQFDDILNLMRSICQTLQQHGFSVIRQKVEIPANQAHAFCQTHAKIHGYHEWHGKVRFHVFNNDMLQRVWAVAVKHQAHISKNALKNQQHHRFITVREYDENLFYQKIGDICQSIDEINQNPNVSAQNQHQPCIVLEKSQAEFCVYDDRLSLDDGWTQPIKAQRSILSLYHSIYPNLSSEWLQNLCGYEALIRRAAMVADPQFILKGNFVTRQYFDNIHDRIPADLDFVCLTPLQTQEMAEQVLGDWVQKLTTTTVHDGILFVAFNENRFWRLIEYAMADDFPTVMTDLVCYIDGVKTSLWLEISFGLTVHHTVPLPYHTPMGVVYPMSASLTHQIAWKLHQSIVRPRFKDLYDLCALVKHIQPHAVKEVCQILVDECQYDQIDKATIAEFFAYDIHRIFHPSKDLYFQRTVDQLWCESYSQLIPFCPQIPKQLEDFWKTFVMTMQQHGFSQANITCNLV